MICEELDEDRTNLNLRIEPCPTLLGFKARLGSWALVFYLIPVSLITPSARRSNGGSL
jgi:hypothetical protein